jgi:hypothetical protein
MVATTGPYEVGGRGSIRGTALSFAHVETF